MLAFFRKYQKGLFIAVSVVVLASFSFFGVQRAAFEKQVIEKDGDIGVAIDGSKMRLLEINRLKRFIRTDVHDTQMLMAKDMPNMLNDGVIRHDFIETGLARILFSSFKDELKEELLNKIARHKRFTPYSHKEAPFLSVQGLWEHIVPELHEAFTTFKKIPAEEYEENVEQLLTLYEYEQKLPPHMLKQFLHYQASQYKWIQPDNELINGNFALFRAKHVSDWFGEQFIDLVAQTIHNAALVAQREGYSVSYKEAKTSLYANAKQAVTAQGEKKATAKEISRFVANQLQYLQLSEFDAVTLWKKVLLFKKYFQDVGSSVFVDTLTLKTCQEYLDKKVEKEVYHFAQPIALQSFREMLGLQLYIDSVTNPQTRKSMHPLDLPQVILPAEHVEKRTPELTSMKYTVLIRNITKADVLMEIPIQDVWALQLEETHFKKLQTGFNELAGKAYLTEEARQEKLDSLDDLVRDKVDRFTREELFTQRPELLDEMIKQVEEREEELALSLGNIEESLQGISNTKAFRELLNSKDSIELYTQDNEHYYSILVKERGKGLELLSYQDAKKTGILDGLLTRHLEKRYPEIREEYAERFTDAEGNWKLFSTVRDEVGKIVYKELCMALEAYAKRSLSYEEYPSLRFGYYFDKVKRKLEEGIEAIEFLTIDAGQWQVTKEEVTSVRSEKGTWYDDEAFEYMPNSWSSIHATQEGRPYIYCVTASGVEAEKLPQRIAKEQEALALEAKKELLFELIEEMQTNDAVHFLYNEKEKEVEL